MTSYISGLLASSVPELLAATPWWVKVPTAFLTEYKGMNITGLGRTYSHYAKELKTNPECETFFNENSEKLKKIKDTMSFVDTKALDLLQTIAQSNAKRLAVKGSGLQCVGQFVQSIPLLAFAVQTSSVLGLLGTGVVTVAVLTPVAAKLIEFAADILNCQDSTKESIHKLTHKMMILTRFRWLTLPAMFYANTFSQFGLQAGLMGMATVTIPLAAFLFWFRTKNGVAEEKLKEKINELNNARKTPPSDEELKNAEAKDKEICKEFYDALAKREKLKLIGMQKMKWYQLLIP